MLAFSAARRARHTSGPCTGPLHVQGRVKGENTLWQPSIPVSLLAA